MIDTKNTRTEGGVAELWAMAFPVIITMASYTVMQFVNRMFLAWYSTDAIAAAVPAGILAFNIVCFFSGIISFCNILVAQYFGNGQPRGIARSIWAGLYFSLLSAVIIVLLVPIGVAIIHSSHHSDAVKTMEQQYFAITGTFGGVPIISGVFAALFIGTGKTKYPMIVNIIGNLSNIAFSYIFIFGKFGMPSLGIKGAAIAMVLASIIMLSIYIYLVFIRKEFREKFELLEHYRFHYRTFKKLLRYGIPSGISLLLEMASFTTFVFVVGNINTAALAANNIILSIELISFMPILGCGMATSALVGQYIGKGRSDVAKKVCYSALKLCVAYCGSIGLLFTFVPDLFIYLFTIGQTTDDISNYAHILIRILALFILCDAFNITFGSTIKGGGDTRFHMIAFLLAAWIFFIPGVLVILEVLNLSIAYAWGWSVLYLFLLAIIFYFRFKSDKWLSHKVIDK
ncbi:MAG: MATE family efflux transporter [Oligoflexia bacterium]|nr:MATE family efflux transporter [Oligoflexia bacterium]